MAKSFWINNVLLNIILSIAILTITENLNFNRYPKLSTLFIVVLWILILIITIWILIGLWRAAQNHAKKYQRFLWANIVKILVILGWVQSIILYLNSGIPQIIEFSKIAFNKDNLPKYEIKVLNQGKELKISGGIKFGLTDDVKEYLHKYPNIKVLHINSIGGRISEANKLSKVIKNQNIITYTSTGCHSACINIFIAGKHRLIYHNASLGFHQPYMPGLTYSEIYNEVLKEEQFYIDQGVEKAFIKKALSVPNSNLWEPSHFELLQANIITQIIYNSKFDITNLSL